MATISYGYQCFINCREIRFTLQFTTDIDSFDEGLEFGIQGLHTVNGDREWIPVMYYASQPNRSNLIYVGDIQTSDSTVVIRGFSVPYVMVGEGEEHSAELKVCIDSTIDVGSLSFRWIQTVEQVNASDGLVFLLIDDISVKYVNPSSPDDLEIVIITDNFNRQTSIR